MNLLKIKWESISLIILNIFFSYSMILHILKNGFDINIAFLEIITYSLLLIAMYKSIYFLRKELLKK